VEELRRESERSRLELAATVDQLKDRISDTAEDIRHKVSPQHIKSEVAGYIDHTTQGWVEALKQQARDNPMQAFAAGTAVAVPLLRLAKGVPLPLLMIGAGLALASKPVRDRAAQAAGPVLERAGEMLEGAAGRAQAMRANAEDGLASARMRTSGPASGAQDAIAGVADDLRSRAAQATAAQDAAAAAPAHAARVIGDNAALIGTLGIAIGAIIAAALPKTKVEADAMGRASDSVKKAAGEAAQSGLGAAKEATMSAVDAAAKSVSEADLGEHASRMTQNIVGTIKEAADDVVRAALDPSTNPHS